jgi:dual specificity phosphatase 3
MTSLSLPAFASANASFVTDRLAIGGDLSPDDDLAVRQLADLVDAGVTHVIDVRAEWSDEDYFAALRPDIDYLHHGVEDLGQRVPGEWFEAGVTFALQALSYLDTVVFTHCHMGINRGPSLGFAVLLAQGWDPIEAIDAIRVARPIAFVAYAEDALRWHHDRTRATEEQRELDRCRLAKWRVDNDLDVAKVIRKIRLKG